MNENFLQKTAGKIAHGKYLGKKVVLSYNILTWEIKQNFKTVIKLQQIQPNMTQ